MLWGLAPASWNRPSADCSCARRNHAPAFVGWPLTAALKSSYASACLRTRRLLENMKLRR